MQKSVKPQFPVYQSPRWSGEVPDCAMPMTFDQYDNCAFGCVYCFSQFQRAIGGSKATYLTKKLKAVDPEKFKKIFTDPKSQFASYINQKKVMQWGGLSDPFCWYEKKYGVGLEILKFLRLIRYPVCFSTKGTWWLEDERYVELFRNADHFNVKFSIITMDEQKAKKIEKGVPTVAERFKAIEKFAKLNAGGATLRLRPFIIGVTNPGHVEMIHRAADAGATAVTTEFFCLEQRSNHFTTNGLPVLKECCGFNIKEFYRQASTGAGYLRLNKQIKRPYVEEMKAACDERGLRFYVSDAHFKECSSNGCCCGLPESWNYSRGQFTEALLRCKKNGQVTWAEIAAGNSFLEGVNFNTAAGFNTGSSERRAAFGQHDLKTYLRWLWNNPKAGNSPYQYFRGLMKPTSRDANGDLIYVYDKSKE